MHVSHLCENLKKEYSSMNLNKVVEKKSVSKTVRSFLSNENVSSEPKVKVAYTLNDFFPNLVTGLKLHEPKMLIPLHINNIWYI